MRPGEVFSIDPDPPSTSPRASRDALEDKKTALSPRDQAVFSWAKRGEVVSCKRGAKKAQASCDRLLTARGLCRPRSCAQALHRRSSQHGQRKEGCAGHCTTRHASSPARPLSSMVISFLALGDGDGHESQRPALRCRAKRGSAARRTRAEQRSTRLETKCRRARDRIRPRRDKGTEVAYITIRGTT